MTARMLMCLPILLLSGALHLNAQAAEPAAELNVRLPEAIDRGDLREAVSAMERLRFQGQLTEEQRLTLAQTYLRLGRLDEAKTEAELVDEAIGGTDLLMLRAALAARGGEWSEARDLYTQVTQSDPSNAQAHLLLGQALQNLGDEAAADAAFAGYVDLTN
jgi:tetratricopeptide (TPR) repeat protein